VASTILAFGASQQSVVQCGVVDLVLDPGLAGVLDRGEARRLSRPGVIGNFDAVALEQHKERIDVALFGLHDVRERADLPEVGENLSVGGACLVFVVQRHQEVLDLPVGQCA
jgi:hypothetical protein